MLATNVETLYAADDWHDSLRNRSTMSLQETAGHSLWGSPETIRCMAAQATISPQVDSLGDVIGGSPAKGTDTAISYVNNYIWHRT